MTQARLGVVMPCFNETEWVPRAVAALRTAADRAGWPVDILVVDDGSAEPTARLLDGLAADGRIRVLRQPNGGRFAARLAGLRAHDAGYVLLLDARVLLAEDALVALKAHVDAEPHSAWNAHVDVHTAGNPFAAFWSGLTKVGWRRYFARPRVVRFGPADFDAYPKGTGAFAAPRQVLLDAASGFASLFADERFASDDTKLLRNVAAATPIGIDPAFRVEYFGRDTASRWAKQVFFRGTTFVDGYVGTPRRAAVLLAALGVALPLGAAATLRWPKAAAAVAVAGCGAGAAACAASGGTPRESAAVAALLPPFAAIFGTGFVRGLAMAVRR